MTKATASRVTYAKHQRRPPALSTDHFQAIATLSSPHTAREAHELINGCGLLPRCLPESVDTVEPTRCRLPRRKSPGPTLSTQSFSPTGRQDGEHVPDITTYPRLIKKRLFQTRQKAVVRSSAISSRQSQPAKKSQNVASKLPALTNGDVSTNQELELASYRSEEAPWSPDCDAAGLSTHHEADTMPLPDDSYSSSPASSMRLQPLSVLGQRLARCVLRDMPRQQLQARKADRVARGKSNADWPAQLGDGFEPTEMFTRPTVRTIRSRRAAKPRQMRFGRLLLVATLPGENDFVAQRSDLQEHDYYDEAAAVDVSVQNQLNSVYYGRDRRNKASPGQSRGSRGASYDLRNVNDNIQQLLQSISAPVRPETPITISSEHERSLQSFDSSAESSTASSRSVGDSASWSGFGSSQSEMLQMDALDDQKHTGPATPSPEPGDSASCLLSCPSSQESLEDLFAMADAADDRHLCSAGGSLDRVSTVGETDRLIQVLDSDGAVLETSQSKGQMSESNMPGAGLVHDP